MNRCAVIFLCVMISLLAAGSARGQAVLPERWREAGLRENVFGVGMAIGAATGAGLSFRHHIPGAWSYEITGGIIKVDDETSYAIGGELQYDLIRANLTRFFVAGGFGYYYAGHGRGNRLEGPGRFGFGIGGEVAVAAGFHVSGEMLFTFFSDGTVLPLPQVGMHYYFY
jgi:hypothetical protein